MQHCVRCGRDHPYGHRDPTSCWWYCEDCWITSVGYQRNCNACWRTCPAGTVSPLDQYWYCNPCWEHGRAPPHPSHPALQPSHPSPCPICRTEYAHDRPGYRKQPQQLSEDDSAPRKRKGEDDNPLGKRFRADEAGSTIVAEGLPENRKTPGGNPENPPDSELILYKGAELHDAGGCNPCALFWGKKGCSKGADCLFCHLSMHAGRNTTTKRNDTRATTNTTVMWRNIPNNYSRDDLLALIDSHDFAGSYDFFYSPLDFSSNSLVGYSFVNFVNTAEADRFFDIFQGFTQWSLKSAKVSQVTWSQPLQGLQGHIERYRNSAVMHPDVSDDKKPMLFNQGLRVPFPVPTKTIRAPHLKECRPRV